NPSLFTQMAYVFPGSSLTGSTQVRLSARYFGLPSTFGKLSWESVDHDQVPSCISLLNVTWISASFGSTLPVPASGTVLTTTGGTDSRATSPARATAAARPLTRATRISASWFIGFLLDSPLNRSSSSAGADRKSVVSPKSSDAASAECSAWILIMASGMGG